MKKDLVVFIDEVMRELLDSEIELFRILWEQYTKIEISEIESTEVGFYVNYELKHKEYKSPINGSFKIGDLNCEMDGLKYGIGFLLYVNEGMIKLLEIYTYGEESWPVKIGKYNFHYIEDEREILD